MSTEEMRDDEIIRTEAEVFALARAWFGLESTRVESPPFTDSLIVNREASERS